MITVIDLSSDDETPTPMQKEKSIVSPIATTQEQTNQEPRQHCQTSSQKSKTTNGDNSCNVISIDKHQSDFIDHVVMIWLNRVRCGYKNLEMPDNILKAKAKEAAGLLNLDNKFLANIWLREFKQKIQKMQDEKQTIDTGKSNVFRIEEIIREERTKFYKNKVSKNSNSNRTSLDGKPVKSIEEKLKRQLEEIEDKQQKQLAKMLEEQKKHLEKVKEAQRQQMEQIKEAQRQRDENLRKYKEMKSKIAERCKAEQNSKPVPPATATKLRFGVLHKPGETKIAEVRAAEPKIPPPVAESVTLFEVIEVDDVLDEPIESYEEALDCLTLIENYFLSTRNLNAVMFISRIESYLKCQLGP